jgi:hypothetical protein
MASLIFLEEEQSPTVWKYLIREIETAGAGTRTCGGQIPTRQTLRLNSAGDSCQIYVWILRIFDRASALDGCLD